MKRNKIIEKLASGKIFYITAAISFGVILLAVITIYRTSTNMLRDILSPDTDQTAEVQKNDEEQPDPRYSLTEPKEYAPTEREYETSLRWNDTDAEASHTEESTRAAITNSSYILPVEGGVCRDYSPTVPRLDETMGDWRTHKGVDFLAEAGTPVKAVGYGRVVKVIADRSYGYILEIDHGDFIARYCGINQDTALKLDTSVAPGDIIGTVGEIPCEAAQQEHLHFEVIGEEGVLNPLEALNKES